MGPKIAKIDSKTAYGSIHFANKENLDLEAISDFVSAKANVGVFSGRYYYEV